MQNLVSEKRYVISLFLKYFVQHKSITVMKYWQIKIRQEKSETITEYNCVDDKYEHCETLSIIEIARLTQLI